MLRAGRLVVFSPLGGHSARIHTAPTRRTDPGQECQLPCACTACKHLRLSTIRHRRSTPDSRACMHVHQAASLVLRPHHPGCRRCRSCRPATHIAPGRPGPPDAPGPARLVELFWHACGVPTCGSCLPPLAAACSPKYAISLPSSWVQEKGP